jgi:transporter family-2 protein
MALSTLQNLLVTLLALGAGASFVVQQAVNSNLRIELGSTWWAGFISYLGGAIVMLIMVVMMREPLLSSNLISRSTWWSWSGGMFGAIYARTIR